MHFDFFFDSANQNLRKGEKGGKTAKKDGKTGIYILSQLFDKAEAPTTLKSAGTSIFHSVFPSVTHLLLSGDTGNGFRAYEMLDELSCCVNTGIQRELETTHSCTHGEKTSQSCYASPAATERESLCSSACTC